MKNILFLSSTLFFLYVSNAVIEKDKYASFIEQRLSTSVTELEIVLNGYREDIKSAAEWTNVPYSTVFDPIFNGFKIYDEYKVIPIDDSYIRLRFVYWANANSCSIGWQGNPDAGKPNMVAKNGTLENCGDATLFRCNVGKPAFPLQRPWYIAAIASPDTAILGAPYKSSDGLRFDVTISKSFGPTNIEACTALDLSFDFLDKMLSKANDDFNKDGLELRTTNNYLVFLLHTTTLVTSFPEGIFQQLEEGTTLEELKAAHAGTTSCGTTPEGSQKCEDAGDTYWNAGQTFNNTVLPAVECVNLNPEDTEKCWENMPSGWKYYHKSFDITTIKWTLVVLDKQYPAEVSTEMDVGILVAIIISVVVVIIIVILVVGSYVLKGREKKFGNAQKGKGQGVPLK